jgi:phage tail-like protein
VTDSAIYRAYTFRLDLQGVTAAYFSQASGLGKHCRSGGDILVGRRPPALATGWKVTLSWGLSKSNCLWEWITDIRENNGTHKDVSIILTDVNKVNELKRWDLFRVRLAEVHGAFLDDLQQGVVIDTIAFVAEDIKTA